MASGCGDSRVWPYNGSILGRHFVRWPVSHSKLFVASYRPLAFTSGTKRPG